MGSNVDALDTFSSVRTTTPKSQVDLGNAGQRHHKYARKRNSGDGPQPISRSPATSRQDALSMQPRTAIDRDVNRSAKSRQLIGEGPDARQSSEERGTKRRRILHHDFTPANSPATKSQRDDSSLRSVLLRSHDSDGESTVLGCNDLSWQSLMG